MLKKDLTFTDFNDQVVTESHYFHLSEAELVELEMSKEGGMKEWIEGVIQSNDASTIISEFKKIILNAYGKKSPDGRRFIKTQELRDEFEQSEAYSTLFMELITDMDAAAAFVNGLLPSQLAARAAALEAMGQGRPDGSQLREFKQQRVITKEMLNTMGSVEILQAYKDVQAGSAIWGDGVEMAPGVDPRDVS